MEHRRQALRDKLANGVDIVGIIAHDIAVIVGIEVLDGQVLHPLEHFDTDIVQKRLRDDGHRTGADIVGQNAREINASHD